MRDAWSEAMELGEAVEGDVRGTTEDLREIVFGVGRAIGVSRRAELLKSQTGLIGRRGCSGIDVLTEDGECSPQGKGLEGKNDLSSRAVCDIANEGEIATEFVFLEEVVRCSHDL